MSKVLIKSRPALANHEAIRRTGVTIEALPEGTVLHVLAHPAADNAQGSQAAFAAAGLSLRPVAPGQWFAVKDTVMSDEQIDALVATLKPWADIVDQSHGRVRILISGKKSTKVLAKGTAVDVSLSAFPIGHASTTLIGHISAHLTRISEENFELTVLRGFAESLWDDLARMSIEFS